MEGAQRLDARLLRFGFYAGILIAASCLLLCVRYLFLYEGETNAAVSLVFDASKNTNLTATQQWSLQIALMIHMYIARLLLLSCGIVVGLGFGFLGFSLFLLGIEGNVDASVSTPAGLRLNAQRMAPGLFVLLAATILVGVCSTTRLPVTFDTTSTPVNGTGSTHRQPPPGPLGSLDRQVPK